MQDDNSTQTGESLEKDYTTDELVDNQPLNNPNQRGPGLPRYAVILGIFALVLILVLTGFLVAAKRAKKTTPTPVIINTQSLDNGTLNKLNVAAPGQSKQQLTITPDTLFKNSATVQGTLKTGQQIEVGGAFNVKGTTTLQSAVGINSSLAVRGALSVGGALTAASLSVGNLVTSAVTASGNINFGGHLVPSGAVPNARASVASANGTAVVSGNDTAGTVTITVGGSPTTGGELAIISFTTPFATTPKVQLTPVNGATAGLNYYVSRSTTFFTLNTVATPSAGGSYVFDYLVTQ